MKRRGNAEVQRRAQEVINACAALGSDNPITFIHGTYSLDWFHCRYPFLNGKTCLCTSFPLFAHMTSINFSGRLGRVHADFG